jgi:hypothetical protein
MLPLHECATESLQDVAESVVDPAIVEATADPAAAESADEPLHYATNPTGSVAALIETFYLCVQF